MMTSLYNLPQRSSSKLPLRSPALKKRYTMTLQNEENKENNVSNLSGIASPTYTSTIRKSSLKDRRRTMFPQWKPNDNNVSFMMEEKELESSVMTPWKDNKISMR